MAVNILAPIVGDAPAAQEINGLSPESIARRRKLAEAMLAQGTDYSPVQSWTQGAARVAQALLGAWNERKLDNQEGASRKEWQSNFSKLFGGDNGTASSQPASTGGASSAAPSSGRTSQAVNSTLSPDQKALLDTIAGTESPGYNVMYGGKRFDSYADHPRVAIPIANGPNAGKTSSAAGRYQFLGSTWDAQAKKLGLKDFSPENQDVAAWDLAATTYAQKTGRDLAADLKDPNSRGGIGQALSGVWTSLPGGIEAGTNQNRFAQAFANNLGRYGNNPVASAAPDAVPLVQTGPTNAQVGDLVQRGPGQGETMPAVQVASANPNFVPAPAGVAGQQASPFTPASQLKQGNFKPGSLTPAQAKQYADSGFNVPNEAINWGQEATPAAPAAPVAAPTPVRQAPPQQVAQAAPPPPPASGQAVSAALADRGGPSVQQLMALGMSPWAPEGARGVINALLAQKLKPNEYGFQSLPDGTIVRTDPRTGTVAPIYNAPVKPIEVNGRLVNPNTGQVIADFSNRQTATVGDSVIDPSTGQVIYKGQAKPVEVGGNLVDPTTGKPIYSAPQKPVSVSPGDTLVDPTTGKPVYQGQGFKPEEVTGLRKEIQGLPSYKSLTSAIPAYQSMVDAAGRDTAASDLNLVYGLAKIMDPTSVVREGEIQMANDTQGIAGRLNGMISSINGGARLQPDARRALMQEAQSRMMGFKTAYDSDANAYRGILERRGMKAEDVIPGLPEMPKWEAPGQEPKQGAVVPPAAQTPAIPAPGAIEGDYRFKGGDPSKPESWEKVQ